MSNDPRSTPSDIGPHSEASGAGGPAADGGSRQKPPLYGRLPVMGRWLTELFAPEKLPYRRYYDREDRGRRLRAQMFAILTLLAGTAYLVWAFLHANLDHPGWSGAFLAAEIFALVLFAAASVSFWRLRYKPPEGIDPKGRVYSVDVFVTTCGEPYEMIRETLQGVAGIRYEGDVRVHVLDDADSDRVRELAERLGFRYLSREAEGEPREDAKAGNLNFGLERTDGELILVLDADQVPRPDIVEVLASYMRLPDVAFVQSKQVYEVPEGDPFNNRDPVFYDAVQLGLDHGNSVISCGSGVLYRWEALEEIGGFATWNLVEDLTTSYELHARGWKSFYHPHGLTVGEAPNHLVGVYRQRGQWCLDTMRMFFFDNPLLKKGLPWRARFNYLTVAMSYIFMAFAVPFFFIVPIWSTLTNTAVLTGPYLEFIGIRAVYFLIMVLAVREMFRRESPGKQFQMQVTLFPVYVLSILRALFHPPGRKPRYRVNLAEENLRRSGGARGWAVELAALSPQLLLLAVSAVLPFYAVFAGLASPPLIAGNAAVSAFAVWTLLPSLQLMGAPAAKEREEPELAAETAG